MLVAFSESNVPYLRNQAMNICVYWSQNQVHWKSFSLHSYDRYILRTFYSGKFLGQHKFFLDSTDHFDNVYLDDLHILNSMMFQHCTTKSTEQFSLQQFSRTLKSMEEFFAKNFRWPAQSSSLGNKNIYLGDSSPLKPGLLTHTTHPSQSVVLSTYLL